MPQEVGLLTHRFHQHEPEMRERQLDGQSGEPSTCAEIDDTSRRSKSTGYRQRHRQGVKEVLYLDLFISHHGRQVDSLVPIGQFLEINLKLVQLERGQPDTKFLRPFV